jgi:hypothetical protein
MIEFYDLKIKLTSLLTKFKELCEKDGRDFDEEVADCIYDAKQ